MNKYLKVPTHNPNVCIRILQLNTANPFRRSVMAGPSLLQPPPCRGGVISVHHDPVHGICTNPGNREWEPFPLSFFVVCAYPVHRVMVNWDPPISQYLGLPGTIQKGNHSILPMQCAKLQTCHHRARFRNRSKDSFVYFATAVRLVLLSTTVVSYNLTGGESTPLHTI